MRNSNLETAIEVMNQQLRSITQSIGPETMSHIRRHTQLEDMEVGDELYSSHSLCDAEVVFDASPTGLHHPSEDIWEEKLSQHLPYSINETYTLLLYYITQLKVNSSRIPFILTFFEAFLPPDNRFSKQDFLRTFSTTSPVKRFHFCHDHKIVSGNDDCCDCRDKGCFLWCSPVEQFVERLKKDRDFYDMAQDFRLNQKQRNGTSVDVYDGLVYQTIAAPITESPGGYSFMLNYDGATKWKSSKTTAIPIYMVCNELPLNQRFRVENILFCGLWFGQDKPKANILFSVLVDELIAAERGIMSCDPYGRLTLVRTRCINASCDIPAKAELFCQKQHGGKGSCYYCRHQGLKMGTRFSYPLIRCYKGQPIDHSMRSEQDILAIYDMLDAESDNRQAIDGIVGKSVFHKLPYWKWTMFGCIDFMHLLMGVFRLLVKLWTKSKYHKFEGRVVLSQERWESFDRLLLVQKIPNIFHRNVRSMVNHHKYWKASECLVFLLYTSRLMRSCFPQGSPHFSHHMTLVTSLYDVLRVGQTVKELDDIEKKLVQYVLDFQSIYGEEFVTLNIHLLTHLVSSIKNHGPLMCYSTFPFESYNSLLMKSIHGTYRVEHGIARTIPLFQHLHERLKLLKGNGSLKLLRKLKVCLSVPIVQLIPCALTPTTGKTFLWKFSRSGWLQVVQENFEPLGFNCCSL